MTRQTATQTQQQTSTTHPLSMGGVLQRKCESCGQHTVTGGECEQCQQKELRLQRRATNLGEPAAVPPIVYDVLDSPGQPLDRETRGFMESRFGRDFSNVRLHTSEQAAHSAQVLNARAYTVGKNVVFAPGQYQPSSKAGRSLLAHELTHTLQQGTTGLSRQTANPSADIRIAESGWAEQEAEQNARSLETGGQLRVSSSSIGLYRQSADSVSVTGPATPHSCSLHTHTVMSALETAMNWLDRSITQLETYISAPTAPAATGTAAILQRHFHADRPSVAQLVVQRLRIIRSDLSQREPAARDPGDPAPRGLSMECHDAADRTCGSAEAYIPGNDRSRLILCPSFLTRPSIESRAGTLIHEVAHTILYPGGGNITDRAYDTNRLAPLLTTAETLDNADSYAGFAQEVGTGAVSAVRPPTDRVDEDCDADVRTQVQQAMAWIERWNFRSEVQVFDRDDLLDTHLGGHTDAIKTTARDLFRRTRTRLSQPIEIQCDSENSGRRSAYFRSGADRAGAGMAIGGGVGGLLGGIAGGLLGGMVGMAGVGAVLGGLVGGLLGLGIGGLIGDAVSRPDRIHLSPTWKDQPLDQRRESLLAAIYEMLGTSAGDAENYARLAHAIHEFYFTPAPPAPTP